MAKLMKMLQPLDSEYVDRRFDGTKEEYFEQLAKSSTLYIGNLSFYTTEDQIYELFSKVGVVQRVIMGLDRNNKTPCGFCFVMYHRRKDALAAVRYLNGTKLDNRLLRVDIDYGFEDGRQFGRGRSGGQVRDEFRTDYDPDRGGYGHVVGQQMAAQQALMWQQIQAGAGMGAPLGPGAMYMGQQQRGLVQMQQQQQHGDAEAAAGGAAEVEQEDTEVVNPRLRGRNNESIDDDEEYEEQVKRKRQRIGGTAAEQVKRKRQRIGGTAAEQQQEEAEAGADMVQGDGADEAEEEEEQQQQQDEEDGNDEERL